MRLGCVIAFQVSCGVVVHSRDEQGNMEFFRKFTALAFGRKRRELVKEGGSSNMDAEPKPKTESNKDVDLNIKEHIEEMKTEENDANQKLLEATIYALEETVREQNIVTEQLKNKVREAHGTRATVEFKLRLKIKEVCEKLEETESDKKEAESALRAQREYYERKLQERDAKIESVEEIYNGVIKRQQKECENRYRGLQLRYQERGNDIILQEEYYTRKQQESEKEKRTLNDEIERLRGGIKEKE